MINKYLVLSILFALGAFKSYSQYLISPILPTYSSKTMCFGLHPTADVEGSDCNYYEVCCSINGRLPQGYDYSFEMPQTPLFIVLKVYLFYDDLSNAYRNRIAVNGINLLLPSNWELISASWSANPNLCRTQSFDIVLPVYLSLDGVVRQTE